MKAIARIVDVRAGEARLVARVFLVLFAIVAGHTILETARDALFLSALPASRLTVVYIALAAIGVVVPVYNARYVARFGRRNALVFTLMIAATGTVLWYLQPIEGPLLYGFYMWSGLLGTLLVVQFWLFAAQVFTVTQGKRLFAGIASGGVLGAVFGGVVSTAALQLGEGLGVSGLLVLATATYIAAALVLTTIPTDDYGGRGERADPGLQESFAVLRQEPYVRRLGAMVALSTVTLLLTDYLFKLVAKQSVAPGELGLFFAQTYAVLNGAALLMQLVVARRILQRWGVVGALSLLPVLLLFGGGGVVLLGGALGIVLATKGADGALRHSLHRVSSELLYLPLDPDVRDRAKSLLDAVFVRGSQAATAGGILLLSTLGYASERVLGALVVVGAVAWLIVTWVLKRGYLDLFREELGRGVLDPRLLEADELDLDSVEAIMGALSSEEPARVLAAMDLLVESGRARLIPALILYHDHDQVLIRALEVVARVDQQNWRPHAARLVESASEDVRTAALRALGQACEPTLVRRALDDPSPRIRAHAAFQLAGCEGGDDVGEHPAVVALREEAAGADEETRRQMRLGFLEALERDADERWVDLLLWLAHDDDPRVVVSVARATLRVPDARLLPHLLPRLTHRSARSLVREALVALGGPALDALIAAAEDPDTDPELRRHLPSAIAAFASQRAADFLLGRLAVEKDGRVRYRVLRALSRVVRRGPARVAQAPIEAEIVRNLREHFRLLAWWWPLERDEPPEGAEGTALLLGGLLQDKIEQALQRTFLLFGVLHVGEDVRGIVRALADGDRRVRDRAREFLDTLALGCEERVRDMLRVAVDELDVPDRLQRMGPADQPGTTREALSLLLRDESEAVRALAAHHAAALAASLDPEEEREVEAHHHPTYPEVAGG